MKNPILDHFTRKMDAIQNNPLLEGEARIKFHMGPVEALELSEELGYDFIAYCGTQILGSIHGGSWEQNEANAACRTCLKGTIASAMKSISGGEARLFATMLGNQD